MGDILKKIVKIESASFEEKFVKLKADGLTYRIWYVKKDQTLTQAGIDYEALPRQGVGSTLEISYVENISEYQGSTNTYRNIIGIKQATETHHENQHSPRRPDNRGFQSTPNISPSIKSQSEVDICSKEYGMCRHAYLLEIFKSHLMDDPLTQEIVNICNDWAYASMYGRLKGKQEEIARGQQGLGQPGSESPSLYNVPPDDQIPPPTDDDIPF